MAEAALREFATAAHPDETGGILVGVRARRTVWITSAIELRGNRGPGHFEIPRGATTPAVREAREGDGRVGYLGEWHSHPRGDGPSQTDRTVMRSLRLLTPIPPLGGPLLVIVRRSDEREYGIDVFRSHFTRLKPTEVLRAGPLPSATSRHSGEV